MEQILINMALKMPKPKLSAQQIDHNRKMEALLVEAAAANNISKRDFYGY